MSDSSSSHPSPLPDAPPASVRPTARWTWGEDPITGTLADVGRHISGYIVDGLADGDLGRVHSPSGKAYAVGVKVSFVRSPEDDVTPDLQPGQVVKLSSPIDPAEERARFHVIEPRGDRVLVELVCNLPIRPTECVPVDAIEPEDPERWDGLD